ncbi:ABC transporter ATP-binding protein [Aestuariibius insulae]|uniref:ABC transporter ATP-binding protein n=1 Tax=Aestuariibius insulae TaxID=2058287 RepID=UPI00345E8BCA
MLYAVDEPGEHIPVLRLALKGLAFDKGPVLGPIELDLAAGETLALVGPSGIGKTTLLRIMAGLETGFEGQLEAPGRCSVVFQEPTLLPWRTLADNLRVTAGISREAAIDALNEVGLAGRWQDFPGQLSLGQQRRLSLARAFAAKPDLLLMDEPFVSLDPDLVGEMMTLFQTLRRTRQVATVLVTHVMSEAKELADRIVTLGGHPARILETRQKSGAYFQLSASGVTSSGL